jgi:hypothetical protein
MRARVFAFWLAFATASTSFAQNAAYSQFPTASADSCATACTSDRMCASWSFGGTVPMIETTSRRNKAMGAPPRMCALSKSLTPVRQSGFESGLPRRSGSLTPTGRYADGPANYEVRPAPWLDPTARMPQPASPYSQGAPIAESRPMPLAPTSNSSAGQVDFLPTQPNAAPPTPTVLSTERSGARGIPRAWPSEVPPAPVPQSSFATPNPVAAAPITQPPAPTSAAISQPVLSQATPQQATDLSKFRGADGMVDAAAMRRSQINSARATGQPAYAVQREWEAVEEERQRAAANGDVRADPLAGTVPVPEAPQPKSARSSSSYNPGESDPISDEEQAAPEVQKPSNKSKGARGMPRAEQSNGVRQSAVNEGARKRGRKPSYIDREPRLSGGPIG